MVLSPALKAVLERCYAAARNSGHRYITIDHLLEQLLGDESVVELLSSQGRDPVILREEVGRALSRIDRARSADCFPTTEFQRAIQEAIDSARARGESVVGLREVIASALHRRNPAETRLLL
jgi:ATP-dependent Clp protease ATP-binding subunit ClpA